MGLSVHGYAAGAADMLEMTQQWVNTTVSSANAADTSGLRMEVNVGALDPRLKLAPCSRVEPYVPVNTRLWGKTRIGLRCLEGAVHWNVFLPITIKAWGNAWVLKSNAAPGTTLRETDAMLAEVDWATDNSPVLSRPDQWVGQTLAYAVVAGQALRQSMVRAAQAFSAGAVVKIVAQGAGFEISTQGQAVGPGVLGQTVRVKTETGNVVLGTVLDAHTVVVSF